MLGTRHNHRERTQIFLKWWTNFVEAIRLLEVSVPHREDLAMRKLALHMITSVDGILVRVLQREPRRTMGRGGTTVLTRPVLQGGRDRLWSRAL